MEIVESPSKPPTAEEVGHQPIRLQCTPRGGGGIQIFITAISAAKESSTLYYTYTGNQLNGPGWSLSK